MRTKNLILGTVSFLFVIILLGAVSAFTVADATIDKYGNSTTITINTSEDLTKINLSASGDFEVSFDVNNFDLNNTSKDVVVTLVSDKDDLEYGTNEVTITATSNEGNSTTGTISLDRDFCEDSENPGNIEIVLDNFEVTGFGDENDFWYLLDEVEVEVEVTNDGNWDIEDLEVEWELRTTTGKKVSDGNVNSFNLDEGDDNIVTINFVLDEDLDDFENEKAVLYVRVLGQVDDKNSAYNKEDSCVTISQEVDVVTEDDFVILNDFKINGNAVVDYFEASCGDVISISTDVWNIGEDNQEEIYVEIYNNELGIHEQITLGDIDAFEDGVLNYEFKLSGDLEEKTYRINFEVFDEDNDVFENGEDDLASFDVFVKVANNCKIEEPGIKAELLSEAKPGKELVIKTIVTNYEDKAVTFSVNAVNYNKWSTLKNVEPATVTLNEGETGEVIFTFTVDRGIADKQVFDIEVMAEGKVVSRQPVAITIESNKFGDFFKSNWKLGGIILLNLILVVAIIIVAVRVLRKR
ncbi:putative S-layer protein [archaeon]|jgi:hypothetical protein|nr:putative S-layer protein [archaeon]